MLEKRFTPGWHPTSSSTAYASQKPSLAVLVFLAARRCKRLPRSPYPPPARPNQKLLSFGEPTRRHDHDNDNARLRNPSPERPQRGFFESLPNRGRGSVFELHQSLEKGVEG